MLLGVVGSRSWVVGSRGREVGSWGRVVRSWGRVIGCRGLGVVGFLRNIRVGFSFIFDIGDVSIFVVSRVSDNLCAPVRELNSVLSFHNTIFILSLSFGEMSAIVVSTAILVGKRLRGLLLCVGGSRSRMVGGRGRWVVGGRSRVVGSGVVAHSM